MTGILTSRALPGPALGDRADPAARATPLPRAPSRVGGVSRSDDLQVADLLLDLSEIVSLLPRRIEREEWLDAYLLAAGADQVLVDALAGRPGLARRPWWRRVAAELERSPAQGPIAGGLHALLRVADHVAARHAASISRLHDSAERLVEELADALCDPPARHHLRHRHIASLAMQIGTGLAEQPPWLGLSLQRLPSCFRSFDQHPSDLISLADLFRDRHPDQGHPVLVVGVRTSGNYLAPLVAAFLRCRGYRCESTTVRPGTMLHSRARSQLSDTIRSGGRVLLIDDPPVSGKTVAAAATQLEAFGVDRRSLVLLLALHGDTDSLPDCLTGWPSILLPWHRWQVHQSLSSEHIAGLVARATGESWHAPGGGLPLTLDQRGHARRELTVQSDAGDQRQLVAEMAGIGYFGRHTCALASELSQWVAPILAFEDGVLVCERPSGPAEPGSVAQHAGAYVEERYRKLPAQRDRSLEIPGSQPVWEVASMILARSLGRPGTALRPFLVEPQLRRLTRPAHPSVIDGRMDLASWRAPETSGGTDHVTSRSDGHGAGRSAGIRVTKDHFAAGFSNRDLVSYDALFDLAATAVELDRAGTTQVELDSLRASFENRTGQQIDEERWLVYQLVQLWDAERFGRIDAAARARASARYAYRYFAAVFLDDLPAPGGPVCAIDLDGVLETGALGFPCTGQLGMGALRALKAHGFRVVLATGRSRTDAIDRCDTLGFEGAVAEYGGALYRRRDGATIDTLDAGDRRAVARLRSHCALLPDVEVDPDYTRCVRARFRGPNGPGLPESLIASVPPPKRGQSWTVHHGDRQTDFVCPGIDKETGMRVLLDSLGAEGTAMAIGDGDSDLSMLGAAARSFAPANATALLRRAGESGATGPRLLSGAYQKGLVQAVAGVTGHRPGSCPICRVPEPPAGRRALLALMSVQEAGPAGYAPRVLRIAWQVLRQEWGRHR